jgi:hypothetical protein
MADLPIIDDEQDEPLAVGVGQLVYDTIMGRIEPELTTAFRPFLESLYATENPAQRAKRMERYKAAFAKYEREYAAASGEALSELKTARHASRADVEEQAVRAETAAEEALLSQIQA